ncbi:MAG: methyltransferase, partial [Sphingorhabdus sp.]
GLQFAPDPLPFPDEAKERIRGFNTAFPENVAKWTGMDASKFGAYTTDTIPDDVAGTVDFVLIPRMLHNLLRWNVADSEIKAIYALLKDDGRVGIVQHRAKPDAPYSYTSGSKGYLREADVIAFMGLNGFDLVKKSEVNANPKDTADYEKGVWTLPPVRRFDKENDAKYQAIGESDRMTLLFKKRP